MRSFSTFSGFAGGIRRDVLGRRVGGGGVNMDEIDGLPRGIISPS